MFRNAIFVTLIAATLVGPCLCCCAFAGFLSQGPTVAGPIATDDQKQPPACPHCRTHSESGATDKLPDNRAPQNPTRDCPCCEERGTLAAIAPAPLTLILVDLSLVAVLPIEADLRIAQELDARRCEHPHGIGTCIFLIDLCHQLRC